MHDFCDRPENKPGYVEPVKTSIYLSTVTSEETRIHRHPKISNASIVRKYKNGKMHAEYVQFGPHFESSFFIPKELLDSTIELLQEAKRLFEGS